MNGAIRPTILVIVGITGDLSTRKLLPAIEEIVAAQAAPKQFSVIGITRRDVSVGEVLSNVQSETPFLSKNLQMYKMDLASPHDYAGLRSHLEAVCTDFVEQAQILFYLSVPPQISQPIVELLGNSGISSLPDVKLLLEKPFGTDLESAKELVLHVKKYFTEEQIYRIDHYLAKEMTQNIVVFKQANPLFARTWSNEFIESIEIIASESIDIEGRAEFYEQTGALRDIVQSHLLQLAALVLADAPDQRWQSVPQRRLAALRDIQTPQDIHFVAVRAQYKGYKEEVGNTDTTVETAASLRLYSANPGWQGVPVTLATGKALADKKTEVRIIYKADDTETANTLILRIQPNEGIEIDLWAKKPGYEHEVTNYPLSFEYSKHVTDLPEAYERVFLDAMKSDHTLFATSDEVLETWRIADPVLKAWEMDSSDLLYYEKGTVPQLNIKRQI